MIVLTGASGFIGSNILYSLNKLGIEELILCDIKTKNNRINNLKDKKFIKIIEPEELTRFLDKNNNVEVIVHMGANSSTTEKNFNKYLLDEKGNLIEWFGANLEPLDTMITRHFLSKSTNLVPDKN